MIIIFIFIFVIIFVFFAKKKINKENFIVYRECGKSKKINELKYEDLDEDKKISVVPINEVMKQEPKEDEIELKKIKLSCDDKNITTYGFSVDDIKNKLDSEESDIIIDTMGKKDLVNNIKTIPLLYNEINSFLKFNFDNEEFTKDIEDRLTQLESDTNRLYDWYIEAGDFGDDTFEKNSCEKDHQCTGGPHLPPRDQGGECVNNKCKCKKGWKGKKCDKRPTKSYDEVVEDNQDNENNEDN